MEPLSDFAVKTCAELLRLASEAAQLDPGRGYNSARRWDRLHDEINDFIDQLRGIDPEPAPLSPLQNALLADYASDTVTLSRKPECSMCDGYRMVKADVLICTRCDHWPLPTLGLGGKS